MSSSRPRTSPWPFLSSLLLSLSACGGTGGGGETASTDATTGSVSAGTDATTVVDASSAGATSSSGAGPGSGSSAESSSSDDGTAGLPPPTDPNPDVVEMAPNSWRKMNPPREPDGRNFSGIFYGEHRIMYWGGGHFSYDCDDVDLYSISTNEWTRSWDPECGLDGPPWVAPNGRPIPTHTYQQIVWAPDEQLFVLVNLGPGTMGFDPVSLSWDVLAGPYHPNQTFSPSTELAWQTMHTIWSPQLESPVAILTGPPHGVHVWDDALQAWSEHAVGVQDDVSWGELYSTYVDSMDVHIVSSRSTDGHFLWTYDVPSNTWSQLDAPASLRGVQALAYDDAHDVVVALVNSGDGTHVLWTFEPGNQTWTEQSPAGDAPVGWAEAATYASMVFDDNHRVFFYLNRIHQDRAESWVYKYDD